MYKIAILGCENSHADNFIGQIKTEGRCTEIEVIGVFSEEAEAAAKLNEKYGVYVMKDYAELVGKVDGIMVTARHGDNHLKYAEPYLASGIPMFIDKPITAKPEDAVKLVKTAKQYGVRLCGGSTCAHLKQTQELKEYRLGMAPGTVIGGTVAAPVNLVNAWGNFTFYAQHLVQIVMEIFGFDPVAVTAQKVERQVYVIFEYGDFSVMGTFSEKIPYYYGEILTPDQSVGKMLEFTNESFHHELDGMNDLLHGKDMTVSYDEFIRPVFVINAIEKSMNDGGRVVINYPEEL